MMEINKKEINIDCDEYKRLVKRSAMLEFLENALYTTADLDYSGRDLSINVTCLRVALRAVDPDKYQNKLIELMAQEDQ